jgi:hypothetical protein
MKKRYYEEQEVDHIQEKLENTNWADGASKK